jgi:hypothetical protein
MKQVSILCHAISKGVPMDSSKTQDMLNWNTPASVTDIHILLIIVGYYWKFIEGFLEIRKPMTELFGKNEKFKWMPACEVNF